MKRTIFSLIQNNLKRILMVTTSVAAVLLLVYTAFSFKQTEGQASRFVMNHVERLAQAGVNSQSVNEIDKEIGRFAQTWEETQDTRLRIDLFLNGKQIGHAGQLQPFRYLFSSVKKALNLPSGDSLRVEIQMDLTGFILSGVLLLLAFEGAIVGIFLILMRSMQASIVSVTQPLESKIAWIKDLAKDLPNSARGKTTFDPTQISEIDDLGDSIGTLIRQIVALEDHLSKVNFDKGRLKMAELVAHNIKGVIATLQLRAESLPPSLEAERQEFQDCIKKLRETSSDLLKSKKSAFGGGATVESVGTVHLLDAFRSVVASKSVQYENLGRITIEVENEASMFGRFVAFSDVELRSILSNLIDNSVEASNGLCKIKIGTNDSDHFFEIFVSDNGRGVPAHIIPLLMKDGYSYEKPDGNGIGLSHAKEAVEAAGGRICFTSELGRGSTVTLSLQKAHPPAGHIKAIDLAHEVTVICVDDDPVIHAAWTQRLLAAGQKAASIIHHHSATEFEEWIKDAGAGTFGTRLYLFDFDLKADTKTGLDLIDDYGLAFESFLVTGAANDSAVKVRASKSGVKLVSKDYLDVIPIILAGQTDRELRPGVAV